MAIVMNMSSYEIERGPTEPVHVKDTLFEEWNQREVSLSLQQYVSLGKLMSMPHHLATGDVELFLQMNAN